MSDTEKPSWEWRALAHGLSEQVAQERVRAHDLQTANTWLAKRVDALQRQLAARDATIQETVMLYQSRIDDLVRRLVMMTAERDRLEALMDDPQALAAYLVERQRGKP